MEYRPEIDGLRALAVVPVIFFHAGFQVFSGGFVGVDIFFVISGYLITSIILAEKQAGTFTLINFYERRVRRILPALFVVVITCIPVAWLLFLPEDMKSFSQSLIAVSTFTSNIYFWYTSGYFDAAAELKPLLHTWSLAVEEQYYIIFPIFLVLTWRLGKRWIWIVSALVVIAIMSMTAAQWGSINNPEAAFFLLPARSWELLIGALVACYDANSHTTNQSQLASFVGLLLITLAVFAFDKKMPFPNLLALIPTIGAALVILYAKQKTIVGKLLGSKPFVGVGLISYSAYLWHQPLFVFAKYGGVVEPGKWLFAAMIVAVMVLAYLTWKYVETPVRNREYLTRKQTFFYGASYSCLLATVGSAGHLIDGFSYRFSDPFLDSINVATNPNTRQTICASNVGSYVKISDKCILGNKSAIAGALVGDSLADALSLELGKSLDQKGLGFVNMSFISCPPILDLYRVDLGNNHKCPEGNRETFSFLKENEKLRTIVLFSHWTAWLEGSNFDNGEGGIWINDSWIDVVAGNERTKHFDKGTRKALVKTKYLEGIFKYIKTGKKIILIYPIPEVGWNARVYIGERMAMKERLPRFVLNDAEFSTSYALYKSRNKETIEVLDSVGEHSNLVRIYPNRILCDTFISGRCVFRFNGKNLYSDNFHLSNAGARLLVDEIMNHF